MMKKLFAMAMLVAFAAAPLAFAHTGNSEEPGEKVLPTPNPNCWPEQNPHDYGLPGSAEFDVVSHGAGVGIAGASDYNVDDCDENGEPGDFDGDYDYGWGGGFFPAGFWADEPICQRGLIGHHHSDVHVHDAIFQPNDGTGLHEAIRFAVGADPTPPMVVSIGPVIVRFPDGTEVTVVEGGNECVTDGCICPGWVDSDDWLWRCFHQCDIPGPSVFNPHQGQPGGDGGYWVFINCLVEQDGHASLRLHDTNGDGIPDNADATILPPTKVDSTCSLTGHIYFPNTWPGK